MQHPATNKNESASHLEALFEYASMGILIADSNGNIKAINPFGQREFGYTEEELIGKKIETLIPSRFHDRHVHHRQGYSATPLARPMGVGMDLFALKKDGTEFPVEVSLGSYSSNGDKYVIAFISNISIRKKSENEIEQLNEILESTVEQRTKDLTATMQQLEEANEKLEEALYFQKAILANAGAIIISTNKDGIIQTFNPEAEKELGYSSNELPGKQMPLIFHDKTELSNRAKEISKELGKHIPADMEVFFAKARLGLTNEYEWTYIRRDGSRFPVLLNVTAMKDEENNITGYLGVALNITESKKKEKELKQSLEKEKELNEMKTRFVSMASHEFRTPLSTVLSSSYLIEKYTNGDDQPKREKHLQRIVSSVNMLTDILNDFLSLGKIEEGKIHVKPVQLNIEELVASVTSELKHNLKKGQTIIYRHKGSPDVLMDVSLLKHILMNLVSNAGKFSPESTDIEIKTVCEKQQVVLSVKDSGMGISKEDQKHLMERFFRGTNATNVQGTGLGLHIVSKYAELMNGRVQCKSELEKGTEFVITFNLTKE
jgi:PAS domain S-box-containing protein